MYHTSTRCLWCRVELHRCVRWTFISSGFNNTKQKKEPRYSVLPLVPIIMIVLVPLSVYLPLDKFFDFAPFSPLCWLFQLSNTDILLIHTSFVRSIRAPDGPHDSLRLHPPVRRDCRRRVSPPPTTHMLISITRAHFIGRLVLLATGISAVSKQSPPAFAASDQRAMSQPDYNVWEQVLQKHVKPDVIRGIPVNTVDYDGEIVVCCEA